MIQGVAMEKDKIKEMLTAAEQGDIQAQRFLSDA